MEKFSTDMFNLVHIHFWIYLFGVNMMLYKEEIKSSINVHLFQLFSPRRTPRDVTWPEVSGRSAIDGKHVRSSPNLVNCNTTVYMYLYLKVARW